MKNIDKVIKIGVVKNYSNGMIHFEDCSYKPNTRGWSSNGYYSVMTYEQLKKKTSFWRNRNRLCRYCYQNFDKHVEKAIEELTDEDVVDFIFNGDPYSRKVALEIRKKRRDQNNSSSHKNSPQSIQ